MTASARPLIQIVPRRSVEPEGVGDYARLIAARLLRDHGWRTIFIAATALPSERRLRDDWQTHELPSRSADALIVALARIAAEYPDVPIIVHLSAYGYHDKGAALWLATALENWRRAHPAVPIVTIFHELFATGPVWRSAFWLGPVQAHIARRIQRISDAGITTTDRYKASLDSWRRQAGPTHKMPVFSTIGDLDVCAPASQRPATLVIFGRPGIYDDVYRRGLPLVEALIRSQRIERIVDIGARPIAPPPTIGGIQVEQRGEIDTGPLQGLLADARFGLLAYDAGRLAKSTIFAAYLAHGVIPVCLSAEVGDSDGLSPTIHYLKLAGPADVPERIGTAALDALQQSGRDWYSPHGLEAMVTLTDKLLQTAAAARPGIG